MGCVNQTRKLGQQCSYTGRGVAGTKETMCRPPVLIVGACISYYAVYCSRTSNVSVLGGYSF